MQEADLRPEGWAVKTEPFERSRANPDTQQALWVLTAAVSVLLLIATVNAANLLLVRATTRQTDIAVRAALGASRGRLVRQQLTENLVLIAAGGVVGCGSAEGDPGERPSLRLPGRRVSGD